MIPASAIKAWLQEPRDNHRWVKSLTHADLDAELERLNPRPQLWPGLHLHQKACFLLGVSYPQFSFWVDMGGGKTLISLELLKYWFQTGRVSKGLIFVKSDKAFPTWERQIAIYGINIPYIALEGTGEQKWESFDKFKHGLVLATYPGTLAMVSRTVATGKGKNKWALVPKLVQRLVEGSNAVVWDESTNLGNDKSLSHVLADNIASKVDVRYALAGRPFGRDPIMLWAQQLLIDGGASLGETKGLFRETFFYSTPNRFNKFAKNYTFLTRMEADLTRMVQHRSITYSSDELTELPDYVPIREYIKLPVETHAYRDRIVAQLRAATNMTEIDNAFIRLRQLSSGYLGLKDAESGERIEIEFQSNPKLDLLMDLLSELPHDRKAVIFYEFTHSGRILTQAIEKLGLKPIWLWSGTKNPRAVLEAFTRPGGPQVAVINNKIGAYSLDGLQIANYLFFYESPVPVIDREQAERRVRRQGQQHRVFQYDLLVRNTADQRILDYHKEGLNLMAALMTDPSRLIDP